jgi:hypothetical protein
LPEPAFIRICTSNDPKTLSVLTKFQRYSKKTTPALIKRYNAAESPVDETDHDRARKRRAVDTAVINVAGSDRFELTRIDVDRRPDSLLHSLLNSVETPADGVPVELDLSSTLSSSQLSTFTYTTAITVALYR